MSDPIRDRLDTMSPYVERRARSAKMQPGGQVVWWTDEEQMLAALRAVLDHHKPQTSEQMGGSKLYCWTCKVSYPCPTARVIAEHLGATGE